MLKRGSPSAAALVAVARGRASPTASGGLFPCHHSALGGPGVPQGSRGSGLLGAAGGCRRSGAGRTVELGPGGTGGDREGPGDTEGHRDTGGACPLLRAAGHRGCPLCRWCRRVPAARRAPQPAHRAPPKPRRGNTADLADGDFVLAPRLCRWGRRVETHVKGATALRMPGQGTVPAS